MNKFNIGDVVEMVDGHYAVPESLSKHFEDNITGRIASVQPHPHGKDLRYFIEGFTDDGYHLYANELKLIVPLIKNYTGPMKGNNV